MNFSRSRLTVLVNWPGSGARGALYTPLRPLPRFSIFLAATTVALR